jgi:hypothetical protein
MRFLVEVREGFDGVLVGVVFKRNSQVFYESLHHGWKFILE